MSVDVALLFFWQKRQKSAMIEPREGQEFSSLCADRYEIELLLVFEKHLPKTRVTVKSLKVS